MAEPRRLKPGDTPRVLIVEDERRLRDLLCDVLPTMGFEPIAERTAESALKRLQHEPIDILILDLNLPVMDGMSFLDRFREAQPHTPVIIMTGFGDLEAAQRAIRHQVVDFLTKPCHLGEIEAALGRAQRTLLSLEEPGASAEASAHEQLDMSELSEAWWTDGDRDEQKSALSGTLAEAERRLILDALRRHAGNRSSAAEELGISRRTLYNRLAEYQRQGYEV